MRFIHTSDLHIGRDFYGYDLHPYQEQILGELLGILQERQPDALLICGDVLDKTNPADTDVNLLSDFITTANEHCQVVMISGNHDGASRMGFLSGILDRQGVHIVTTASQVGHPIEITRDSQLVGRVYPLPYLYPFQARDTLATWIDARGERHPDAYFRDLPHSQNRAEEKNLVLPGKPGIINSAALRRIGNDILARGRDVPLVGMAHDNFTRNFTPPLEDQSRYAVGCLPNVDNTLLATLGGSVAGNQGLDYFALGHIHRCYPVVRADGFQAWYSGSPLPYATDDTNQKYVLEVNIDENHQVNVTQLPLSRLYRVKEITDSFGALKNPQNPHYLEWHEAFCKITITEDYTPDNALQQIKSVFPRMTRFQISARNCDQANWVSEEISPLDFATKFLENSHCSPDAINLCKEIYAELSAGGTV